MITKDQAFQIARNIVPDIELRGIRISEEINSPKLSNLPKNCWYISYCQIPISNISCSNSKNVFLSICKFSGEVLFHNTL